MFSRLKVSQFLIFTITLIDVSKDLTVQGARGVGKATTNAVVISSILILISNYFITTIFFGN